MYCYLKLFVVLQSCSVIPNDYYSCGLSTATMEYLCPSVCLSVCLSVYVDNYTILGEST